MFRPPTMMPMQSDLTCLKVFQVGPD